MKNPTKKNPVKAASKTTKRRAAAKPAAERRRPEAPIHRDVFLSAARLGIRFDHEGLRAYLKAVRSSMSQLLEELPEIDSEATTASEELNRQLGAHQYVHCANDALLALETALDTLRSDLLAFAAERSAVA